MAFLGAGRSGSRVAESHETESETLDFIEKKRSVFELLRRPQREQVLRLRFIVGS
ncbi:hypothetical protein ACLOJK_025898 [Asimina triloba]